MKYIAALFMLLASSSARADYPVTMWEVDGERNSVYLLGSIHLLREQDHPLPEIINAAYRNAEVVIMEIDMDDLDPIATQTLFSQHGMISDGRTLADWMGERDYARASNAAEEIGIPLHMMSGVEPWYAALTVEILVLIVDRDRPTCMITSLRKGLRWTRKR